MRVIYTQCTVCRARTKWVEYADGRLQCTECLSVVERRFNLPQLSLFRPQIVEKDVKKDGQ